MLEDEYALVMATVHVMLSDIARLTSPIPKGLRSSMLVLSAARNAVPLPSCKIHSGMRAEEGKGATTRRGPRTDTANISRTSTAGDSVQDIAKSAAITTIPPQIEAITGPYLRDARKRWPPTSCMGSTPPQALPVQDHAAQQRKLQPSYTKSGDKRNVFIRCSRVRLKLRETGQVVGIGAPHVMLTHAALHRSTHLVGYVVERVGCGTQQRHD